MDQSFNPYESPASVPPSTPIVSPHGWIAPFESGHARAVWAMGLLAIVMLIDLAGMTYLSSHFDSPLLRQQFNLGNNSDQIDPGATIIGLCDWVAVIGVIIAFPIWTHRAARNLPALGGQGLKYTPGWAAGWYFVPIANLIMPYLVMAEIWQNSDPEQGQLNGYHAKRTSPLVTVWWICNVARIVLPTLIGFVVGFAAAAQRMQGPGFGNGQNVAGNDIASSFILATIFAYGLELLAAVLAMSVVYLIDKNQQVKYAMILNEPTQL